MRICKQAGGLLSSLGDLALLSHLRFAKQAHLVAFGHEVLRAPRYRRESAYCGAYQRLHI